MQPFIILKATPIKGKRKPYQVIVKIDDISYTQPLYTTRSMKKACGTAIYTREGKLIKVSDSANEIFNKTLRAHAGGYVK